MNEEDNSLAQTARRWFAKLLSVHGGGLYAFGYACTFVYLEIIDLAEDFAGLFADDVSLISFIVEIFVDSIMNMVESLIWFVPIVSYQPPIGVAILAIAFYVFEKFFRVPLGQWISRHYNEPDNDDLEDLLDDKAGGKKKDD